MNLAPAVPRRRSRSHRTLLVVAIAVGAGLTSVAPANAQTNTVQNNGLETLGPDGFPTCWERSGWGDNDFTFTVVPDTHSGSKAMKIELTRHVDGDRKAMMMETGDLRARRSRRASSTTWRSGTSRPPRTP